MTEAQLIRDCKEGKKKSQYQLVKRYSGMLLSVCMRYCRDKSSAHDALQETLIRIFKYIDQYQETGSFEAWMRTIAARCSLQWIDRSYFKKEVNPEELPEKHSIEPEIYAKLEVEELMNLITSLPPGFRTVLNLYEIEGFSHKEIAELLSISESTSRSQLTRAKSILKKKLLRNHKYSAA